MNKDRSMTSSVSATFLILFFLLSLFFFPETSCPVCAAPPMSWSRFDGPEHNRVSKELNFDLRWTNEKQNSPTATNLQLFSINEKFVPAPPLVFNDKFYLASYPFAKSKMISTSPRLIDISCWHVEGREKNLRFRYQITQARKKPVDEKRSSQKQRFEKARFPLLVGDPLFRQLFCLTRQGEIHVIDSDLGHLLWKKSISEILGKKTEPATVAPPLIFEHCFVIPVTWYDKKTEQSTYWLVTLDRRNGQVIWITSHRDASVLRSSPAPISAVYRGQIVVVAQLEQGTIQLHQMRTGKQVAKWKLIEKSAVARELLFESEQLAVLSEERQDKTKQKWGIDLFVMPVALDAVETKTSFLQIRPGNSGHVTTLLHKKRLYVVNAHGMLREHELPSGDLLAETSLVKTKLENETEIREDVIKKETKSIEVKVTVPEAIPAKYHLLFADHKLLVTSTTGRWCVLSRETLAREKKRVPLKIKSHQQTEPVIALPVIAKQKMYVLQSESLTVLGVMNNSQAASEMIDPLSILAKEKESKIPGMILMTPRLQNLKPGWKQKLQVQLFSNRGTYLRTLSAKELQWGNPRFGKIEQTTGTYFAPKKVSFPQSNDLADHFAVHYKSYSATATVRLVP